MADLTHDDAVVEPSEAETDQIDNPRAEAAARAEAHAIAVAETPEEEADVEIVAAAGYDSADIEVADDGDGPRPFEQLLGKAWAIVPEALLEIGARLASGMQVKDALQARSTRAAVTTRAAADGSEVAVIPLRGTITPRGSLFSILFGGGGGLQGFRENFRQAVADSNTSAIVIDIDSPGGLIDLVPEAAEEIRAARGSKPIVASCNTLCASAAYWIAAQADEVVATPSGQVGSIGVFTIHEDLSGLEKMMGVKTTIISAGTYKTEGNPYEPLSKQGQQAIQKQVNELYGMFTGAVGEGRGVSPQAVAAGYGQGRCLLASQALTLGMVDRVETFEETVARLGGTKADADPDATLDEALDADDDDINAAAQETSPTAGDDTPPIRAEEDDGDSHPTVDYLSDQPGASSPAWSL